MIARTKFMSVALNHRHFVRDAPSRSVATVQPRPAVLPYSRGIRERVDGRSINILVRP